MIEWLIALDKKIFLIIHEQMSNPVFDFIMPWIRDKYIWIPLYLFFVYLIIYFYRRNSYKIFMLVIAIIGSADYLSSGIFKPLFHRLRPCQNPEFESHIHHIINCGSGFSFMSSHAANHFALAILLGYVFRKQIKWLLNALLIWAAIICFAQVYIAYHYPADVLGGALLGIGLGLFGSVVLKYSPLTSDSPQK